MKTVEEAKKSNKLNLDKSKALYKVIYNNDSEEIIKALNYSDLTIELKGKKTKIKEIWVRIE